LNMDLDIRVRKHELLNPNPRAVRLKVTVSCMVMLMSATPPRPCWTDNHQSIKVGGVKPVTAAAAWQVMAWLAPMGRCASCHFLSLASQALTTASTDDASYANHYIAVFVIL
jgi:hypothetical protein